MTDVRVLHLFAPASAGGLESVIEMLLPGLSRRGVSTAASAVIGVDQPEPPCLAVLRSAGIEVTLQRVAGRAYRTEVLAHRAAVTGFRANVVHTHGYRADVLGGIAAGDRVPRVATVHGFTGGDWKNQLYEWLQVRSYRKFNRVVAVSRLLRDQLVRRGVSASRLALIPNAFQVRDLLARDEARLALGLPKDATVVGWVGRLSSEKGPDLFLRAAAELNQPGVRFVLVGDGPERGALQNLSARLGISGRVDWPGLVPSAGRYFRAFDAFVLSSRTEGTPIALFEAMSAGVPVIATQVGGVPDVVDPATASLVPPDQPSLLAKGLTEVFRNADLAKQRALLASERVARVYAPSPWVDRYCELYARLLNA